MEIQVPPAAPVLLIVDDPGKIRELEAAFAEQDIDLVEAESMEKGLALIHERTFALVVLDIDMPGSDAFKAVKAMRGSPETAAVPILFISSEKPGEADLHRGYHLGIVDFVYAPIDSRALSSKMAMLARIYRENMAFREQVRVMEKTTSEQAAIQKRNEENFRLIVENAKDYAIFMMDTEGRITTWNPGAERVIGYREEEILGQPSAITFTPEDLAAGEDQTEMNTARREGKATDERWHVRKDGTRFWASGLLSVIHDEKGAITGFVKIMRDFTERETARAQLMQSEERFRTLVEEIRDYAIFMLDAKGMVVTWNKGAERILGYEADAIRGRHFSAFYIPEDLARNVPAVEMKLALETGRNREIGWRVRKDGTWFWGEEIITPIRNVEGILTGFTKVTRDITMQKNMDDTRASHVRYLEVMSDLSKVFEQNLEMEQVLQVSVERVREHFQGDLAFLIHPLDPSRDSFRILHAAERPGHRPFRGGAEITFGDSHRKFVLDLLASGEPVVDETGPAIPGFEIDCDMFTNGTMVTVALRPKHGMPWALGVHQCSSHRKWSPDEFRLLKDLASRLTDVLDNLMLHRDLQASESRFRWLVENTTEVIWRFDLRRPMSTDLPEGEQLDLLYREAYLADCNDAMARRYGHGSAAEIIGVPFGTLFGRNGSTDSLLRDFIRSRHRNLDAESVERDGQGRNRYVLYNLVGLVDGDKLTGVWGTSRDITDRKMAEEEVRRSRDQLDVILQGIADAILVYSPRGALVYFNEAASRMLDLPAPDALRDRERAARVEDALDRLLVMDVSGKAMPPEETPVNIALRGKESQPTLLRYRLGPQGAERWLITRAKPILDQEGKVRMVISIAQDTTDLRRTEEQFRQSQKMEAIGRLAGGVAHDFNNLLTAINGYSELLLAMTGKEDARRQHIEEIRKAGERAASLTNQLLVYSRRQIVSPKTLNLNSVVSQMETMLRRLIGEDIDLVVRLKPDLDAILADPGQIEQVILNLAVNSRDAMPKGGTLTLETSRTELGPDSQGINEAVAPGTYVQLTVRDSGVGIDDTVKSHLFEPFFTTKKTGRGTGLGLSTVYGIVRQSGGHISVESERGAGATFKVFFPTARDMKPEHAPAEPETQESAFRGGETILVVEDDLAVRNLVKNILASFGYSILEAGNGIEALEVANGFHGKIDLLLTDVVMAQMGGRELVDKMKYLRPDLKYIYMSGYTDDAIVRHGVLVKSEQFIQKPFSPASLVRKVRSVLDFVEA
ncbi:MAG: Blue-light-activated protein [Fibrobacteres bacterium]|nr:Blue-light-activated protein [Fibrobacterota bacterium]